MNHFEQLEAMYPSFTDEEWHDVLWEATAFPCCDADTVVEQVKEYHDAGFTKSGQMIAYAYWLLDFTMDLYHPRRRLVR